VTAPNRYAVLKDAASFIGGWWLLIHQVRYVDPAKVNEAFLWVAVGLIGLPSLTQVWAMRNGGAAGTGVSPSPPDPPPSSPQRSPSAAPSGGSS
jgi:hypothetical protein